MKKSTLFLIMLSFLLTANAQHVFDPIAGPTNVVSGSPVTFSLNDTANTNGVPASSTGSYGSFSITADWIGGGGNPWSSEAEITLSTVDGGVAINTANTGSAFNGDATTLTFSAEFLAPLYNPTINGFLELELRQSFGGSDADWSNIVVTLIESPSCIAPAGMVSSNATTTSVDLDWAAGDSETTWNIEYNGGADFVPGNGEEEASTTVNTAPSTALTGLTPFTTYFVYYQADCDTDGNSEWVGPVTFITGYCESLPTSNDGNGIAQVQLASETFISGGDITFEDFTSPTVDIPSSSIANFQINFETGFTYNVYVWIDINNDLVYDNATELLFSGQSTNANPTTFNASFLVPNIPLGTYNMRMVSADFLPNPNPCYSGSFGVTADFTLNITAPPACAQPSELTVENITSDSADLSWTELGSASLYNIEVVPTGTAPTGIPTITGVANPYTVTNLDAITGYDFYVQADCGTDQSVFTGPLSFITTCSVFVPDYLEEFTTIIPDCWDEASNGDATTGPLELGGGAWIADEYLNVGENDGAYKINLFAANKSDWIISPTFDLTGANAPFQLEFDFAITVWNQTTAGTLGSDDTVQILITADNGATWTPLLIYDNTSVVPAGGEHQIIDLTAYNGSFVQFGILGSEGTVNDPEDMDVFVDNFEVVNIPNCTNPIAEYDVVIDCDNDQFSVSVDITDFGTATSLIISNDFDTTTVQATSLEDTYLAGPFAFGTTVRLFVTNEQDGDCVINSGFFQVLACPPTNDNPCDATVAVVNDSFLCVESTPGTLLAATDSGVPAGSCGGNPDDDVWFQFVAQEEIQLISLANYPAFENIDHALYSGTCDALVELDCKANEYSTITPPLTIGDTYFIRVFSGGSSPESINFDLCITPYAAPANISCDLADSYCSGSDATDILYTYNTVELLPGDGTIDCLGSSPNPTYSILQIGTSGDILIEMVQNTAFDGNDNPIGDGLDVDFLLWGPYAPGDDLCNLGSVVDCSFSAAAVENVTLIGAQQDEIYLLLITNYVGGFSTAVNGGIIQVRQTNISEPGAGSTIADIEAEITSNEVVFVDTDGDPSTPVEANVCGFETVTILADSPFADSYVWYKDGFVMEGEISASLVVTESDNYQVQAFDDQCGSDAFSQVVIVNLYDDAGTIEPQTFIVCDGDVADGNEDFNLDELSTGLGLGEGFTVSYYTNTSDANQAINAVPSIYNSSGETLIIRVEDTDAAANGFLGCRSLSDVELIVNARPIISQPIDFIVCDDLDGSVDGITDFDLTSIDSEISTDANIVITYHASQDDANNGTGDLVSPYSSEGETIFVRAEDATNSCFETTSFNIGVNIVPIATFDLSYDYEVCPNATSPVEIGLIPTNFSANEVTIQWYLDNVLIPGQSGLLLSNVLLAGEYRAVIEFNDTGCINDAVTTSVIELESCIIPQGISPNGDEFNQNFDLSSYDVTKLEIFNRNGTLVYSKKNYTNQWIGQTNDGEELPVGTYFYTMEYEGGTKKRSAWIYINR